MCATNREIPMKRLVTAVILTACGIGIAFAAADSVAQRRAIMKKNGEVTKVAVEMLKGAPFDLAAAQAALQAYANAAEKMPALFPDDSKTGGDTAALPAIWENKADVTARFGKLGADAKAAMTAITDEASFKAKFPDVLKNCGGCHELYKVKQS